MYGRHFGWVLALLFLVAVPLTDGAMPSPVATSQVASKPLDFLWVMRSWDAPEGQQITALALSPDATRIAIGGKGTVALVDRETGKEVWQSNDQPGTAESVNFSNDGKQLIVAGGQNTGDLKAISVIDAETGKTIRRFPGNRYLTRHALLSPDGSMILSCGGSDYSVEGAYAALWDSHSGRLMHKTMDLAGRVQRETRSTAFFPDGKQYLCVLYDGVTIHDTASGKLVSQLAHVRADSAAISPLGDRAVICGDKSVIVWDIARNENRRIVTGQRVTGAAFTSEDVCVTWGIELRMWNVATGEELSWSGSYESDVVFGAAAGKYVVGSNGRRVSVWGLPGVGIAPPDANPLAGDNLGMRLRPRPPIVMAAERGDTARVAALLARGAAVNAMCGWTDRSGTTALHLAPDYATARALVDAGADVNARSSFDWNRTPLHFAVERYKNADSLKIIDLLLDRAARIEDAFGYDETPMQLAAKSGHKELVDHLVARGAYYDIYSAAALGDIDRLKVLLAEKPELARQRARTTRRNALYWATTKPVIDILLQAGAQTDITDAWGATPEHDLRGNAHGDLADYLRSKSSSNSTGSRGAR